MKKALIGFALAFAVTATLLAMAAGSPNDTIYLFSSFREPDGVGGLRLSYSEDFFHWKELPGPFFQPTVGVPTRQKGYTHKTYRDAYVTPDPNGGFRMTWTSDWRGRSIGYARSKDLIHWEDEKTIPVMEDRPANNAWAPKLFYDEGKKQWLIFWSTTLNDDTFPKPTTPFTTGNHRIWYVTTKDFQTFSKAQIYFDPGYSTIDAYLFQEGPKFYLFFKDMRENRRREPPFNPMYMNIRYATADSPYGPFGNVSGPVTGKGKGIYLNEGPSVIKVKGYYYVFYDHYGQGAYYGASRSKDLKEWEDVTEMFTLPDHSKHGHIFAVKRKDVAAVLARQPAQ